MEQEALVAKRQNNIYDIVGVMDSGYKYIKNIEMILNQNWASYASQ